MKKKMSVYIWRGLCFFQFLSVILSNMYWLSYGNLFFSIFLHAVRLVESSQSSIVSLVELGALDNVDMLLTSHRQDGVKCQVGSPDNRIFPFRLGN